MDRFRLAATAVFMIGVSSAAGAQTVVSANANDDIVVTGQFEEAQSAKSDVPLIEVPQAISVITAETIKERGVTRLADALLTVAGASRSSTYGFYDAYTLRGFDASYGSVYLDGLINQAGGGGSVYELVGLESVEVVKGPASVLYGGGSLGGLVNLVSKRPDTGKTFVDATLSTGSYHLVEGTIDANAPLTGSGALSARLVALYRDVDSFVRFAGQNRIYLQPSLRWKIGAETDLTVIGTYKRDRDNPFSPLNAYGTVLPNVHGKVPIDFSVNENGDEKAIQNETRATIGYIFDHHFSERAGFSQSLRYMDRKTFWDRWMFAADFLDDALDADGNPIPGTGRTIGRYYYGPYRETFRSILVDNRATLKADTGPVRHNLLGGFDYRHTDSRYDGDGDFDASHFPLDVFNPDYSQPLRPVGAPYMGHDTGSQRGFYLQDHLELGERVTATVNGRWDRAISNGEAQTAFSPRVGATVELVKGAVLYATWAKSFSPQFGSKIVKQVVDGVPTVIGQAPPERGENYEIGMKLALPAAGLTGMISVYRLSRRNVLTADPDFPLFSRVTGLQRSKGIEVEAQWRPMRALTANLAYSYIEGEIAEDETIPVGTPLPNVPRHNLAGYARYVFQGGGLAGLGLSVGAQYNSRRFIYDSGYLHDNLIMLGGYTVFNTGLSYEFGAWEAQVNVNNLFDERYYPDACCQQRITPGQPRNFRLTIARRF
ncbi:TonB-dependent siderophore receptor [Sphingomonas alpina]|uniref:TonB-dependent siderophore receptor n=1 Tax=Sphingomonas alpina TaxID=653931 RepID=A0A7H0LJG9_9SPHN|nr:TonB-dependent siderophore receptor [Sphingomonas alpina]QNQ09822.1 TonB-dependent siderophore receptor [Sphingomonas alpina]